MARKPEFTDKLLEQPPRRTVWAAPFVLLIAAAAGLAAAYPSLRPGDDATVEQVAEAAAVPLLPAPAELQPDGAAAEAPAARVVSGSERGAAARVEVTAGALSESETQTPVVVVRGRAPEPVPPAGEATGTDAAALGPVTVAGVSFALCRQTPYTDCVVDGDTFYHHGTAVRIADIDAPEVGTPACLHEAEVGTQATYRLLALLNAGRFVLAPAAGPATDDYGRALRLVLRDGRSLGGTLVHEGLARAWDGPAARWCG